MRKRLWIAGLAWRLPTVTGRTGPRTEDGVTILRQDVIRSFDNPIKKDSHLIMLAGNLAPDGAVAKITGKEGLAFTGTARVFEGEERATAAILAGKVKAGDVVVIRGEGPVGGPGMREMLSPTGAIMGRRATGGTDNDADFGGAWFVVGPVSPEAAWAAGRCCATGISPAER